MGMELGGWWLVVEGTYGGVVVVFTGPFALTIWPSITRMMCKKQVRTCRSCSFSFSISVFIGSRTLIVPPTARLSERQDESEAGDLLHRDKADLRQD